VIKVNLEINLSRQLEELLKNKKDVIDRATADEVGKQVVEEMKNVISSGISPIEGVGKFPQYKNPKRYPGNKKSRTPVNLSLTGAFQDALTYKSVDADSGKATEIFYKGNKEEIKERGHREGANGQPKRPTLPADSGQNFSARIRLIYTNLIRDRILKVLKGES